MSICIPYLLLKPITAKLSAQRWFATNTKKSSGKHASVLARRLERTHLTCAVRLGSAGMTVDDLIKLQVGDVVTLDGYFYKDGWQDRPCDGAPTPIGASRSRHIDAMLASERVVRAQSADFVRRLALGESTVEDAAESGLARRDLAKVLASSMTWYIEFPHVDGLFLELAKTLPGYGTTR